MRCQYTHTIITNINCDAAFVNSKTALAFVVIKDDLGVLVQASSTLIPAPRLMMQKFVLSSGPSRKLVDWIGIIFPSTQMPCWLLGKLILVRSLVVCTLETRCGL